MKTLLVDDHPLILSALRSVIEGLGDGGCEVVTADSACAARQTLAAEAASFDLVLLDLQLGDADGFELLAELRRRHPALPVVVVSGSDRSADVVRAVELGAMGFVPKRASTQLLFDALRLVMSGGIYVPPMVLGGALEASRGGPVPPPASAPGPRALPPLASLGLTPRQGEVLGLLLQGQSNKLIARELKLSVETVKDHVAAVLRTLGVANRTQAVLSVGQMAAGAESFRVWKPAGR